MDTVFKQSSQTRRSLIQNVLGAIGAGFMLPIASYAGEKPRDLILKKNEVRITKLETFLVKPRWIFLKIQHIHLQLFLLNSSSKSEPASHAGASPPIATKLPRSISHPPQLLNLAQLLFEMISISYITKTTTPTASPFVVTIFHLSTSK